MSAKNTEFRDLPKECVNMFLSYGDRIRKHRRLKVGCPPDICQLQELMLLKYLLCKQPCYLNGNDINKLEQRLIQITNV